MAETLLDDDGCRRLAGIFSGDLSGQIRNEEWLLSRCAPVYREHHETMLRNLRRAAYLSTTEGEL